MVIRGVGGSCYQLLARAKIVTTLISRGTEGESVSCNEQGGPTVAFFSGPRAAVYGPGGGSDSGKFDVKHLVVETETRKRERSSSR